MKNRKILPIIVSAVMALSPVMYAAPIYAEDAVVEEDGSQAAEEELTAEEVIVETQEEESSPEELEVLEETAAAEAFDYDGDEVIFIGADGAGFGMYAPQEGTGAFIDGDQVEITYLPKNKTVYAGFYFGDITMPDTWEGYIEADSTGNYAFTVSTDMCGKAWPIAVVKPDGSTTGKQYYLAIPSADKIPAKPVPVVTASVTVRAQNASEYLDTFYEPITVSSDLAESYGYVDEVSGAVSVLDAAVAEHARIYGEAFTKDSKSDYFVVTDTGSIKKMYGVETYSCSFFINGAWPNDGTQNDRGEYNLLDINDATVTDGDVIDLFVYSDLEWAMDYYTYITTDVDTVEAGAVVNATVEGCMAMYAMYVMDADEMYDMFAEPMEDIGFVWIDKYTNEVFETDALSDEDGEAEVTAPMRAGEYWLAAVSSDYEDVIKIPVAVTVTKPLMSATVSVRAQIDNDYVNDPRAEFEISSDLAESYGYYDEAIGVSAIDALVAVHEAMYDDFSAETCGNYLMESGGSVSKLFGVTTWNSGFMINGGQQSDGTESPWGGYNMLNIAQSTLVDGDVIDFLIYMDGTYWSDNFSFLDVPETVSAGEAVQVTVIGNSIMNTYLYPTPEEYVAAATPLKNAGFFWINEAGDKIASSVLTGEDGKAEIEAPSEPGSYLLTACGNGSNGIYIALNAYKVDVIDDSLAIIEQPEDTNGKVGDTISYSVKAVNADTYQWYYSKNGTKWYKSAAEGFDTDTITLTVKTNNIDNIYRCLVTGADGTSLYSDNAENTIKRLVITKQPESKEGKVGEAVTYTVEADNAAAYQWYYSKDGGTKWYKSTAAGADTASISVTPTSGNIGSIYRCKVTGEDGTSVNSDAAGITNRLAITAQPESVEAKAGDTVTFTVKADNADAYQWYYSKDGGAKWYKSSTTGADSDTMTLAVKSSNISNQYRCKVTGTDGTSVNSEAAGVIAE